MVNQVGGERRIVAPGRRDTLSLAAKGLTTAQIVALILPGVPKAADSLFR